MKTILAIMFLMVTAQANAEVVNFTYRFDEIPNDTVVNNPLYACEYKTKSNTKIVLLFEFFCPFTVELKNYGKRW